MSSPNEGRRDDDPLVIANQIDVLCDDFESSWKRGEPRRIEEVLGEVDESLHDTLLPELLKVDLAYVRRRGESIPSQNYALRFPRHLNLVMRLAEKVSGGERDQEASQWIGGYKLLESVGSGSYGVVWKAWDSDLRRIVAVKVPVDRLIGPEQRELFLREAKSAARLQHSHIVPVYHCGEHDGKVYIVSAFIEGTTLKEWSRDRKHTPEEAVSLCIKLAEALDYAHLHGVIHRDLKPSNVLIDRKGEPYITDFGMAKQLDETTTLAPSGTVVGTLAYMPREQALGQSHLIDRRSDVYSLGATLYELLTGQPPFTGEPAAVMQQVIHDEPVLPRTIDRGLPTDLKAVCLKAISKDQRDRYSSAAEFAEDLRRFLGGLPVIAKTPSVAKRLFRIVRRHPSLAIASSIAALATLALFFLLLGAFTAADDDRWNVNVITEPAGARVVAIPKDARTLRPQFHLAVQGDRATPVTLRLPPGEYRVIASLPMTNRFHEVERTVPPRRAEVALGATNNKLWKMLDSDTIEWRRILIPEESVTDGMMFLPGKNSYQSKINAAAGDAAQYRVPDLFVSPSTFTNAMFLDLRPNAPLADPARVNPADAPYQPESLDFAIHFAEEAGYRLPDEVELEYANATLSHDAAGRNHRPTIGESQNRETSEWTDSPPFLYESTGNIFEVLADARFYGIAIGESRPSPGEERGLGPHGGVRYVLPKIVKEPRPGLRMFRSPRPRLRAEDYPGLLTPGSHNKP